jgi:xanthine/uracil/vitamin C permease (AzgA family)
MVGAKVPHELQAEIETAALGIFTDMSNAGFSFQEALAAVFVSGMHAGSLATDASTKRQA